MVTNLSSPEHPGDAQLGNVNVDKEQWRLRAMIKPCSAAVHVLKSLTLFKEREKPRLNAFAGNCANARRGIVKRCVHGVHSVRYL